MESVVSDIAADHEIAMQESTIRARLTKRAFCDMM